ncbi:MAG TPA: M20/M25/M40 family metallo-hydrolase [Cyclobacteriaceae bacterium]|nr:M20/M25/M40 family metallo-hydrolase [Cyclobacteriaceae bacterium]
MKRIPILILIVGLLSHPLFAQDVNKLIKEKQVARIINTLASDDMRGRSALVPEDINKAGDFIEKQFKKAGLQPLQGLSGYRQEFQKMKLSRTSLKVIVAGTTISDDRLILSSGAEVINLNSSTPMDTIGKSQPLFPSLSAIERNGGDRIVLVDKTHTEEFKTAHRYLNRSKILDPDTKATGSILYILDQKRPSDISVKGTQSKEIITMANIVGILPGRSKPDESVIFSAHYDHIGIQKPVAGDSIANGADDDASGTTAIISLAKYFSKIKTNERSLIFVAFTAEEIGGFGSKYFSQQLDPEKIIAMFNIEMIGKPSKWGQNAAFITGFGRSTFGEILQENLKGTEFQIHPDPYPEQNLFYRSDNATLARLGVPAHSISTDQIPTDPYYHTVDDEVSTLDMANITAAIRGIALSSKTIVEGVDTPSRVDKSKVN